MSGKVSRENNRMGELTNSEFVKLPNKLVCTLMIAHKNAFELLKMYEYITLYNFDFT